MACPPYSLSIWNFSKRIRISTHLRSLACKARISTSPLFHNVTIRNGNEKTPGNPEEALTNPQPRQSEDALIESDLPENECAYVRLPRAVQAVYLRPLRRQAKYGVPVCDLQLRSYSVRNLEFMADFALRVAYYLNLPAAGPIPLPRITERWTVPRSSFIYKKSQENFERITMRRLIQISDGHSDVVQVWLAYLRKHAYYGVGMKANVWQFEGLGVGKSMNVDFENLENALESTLSNFGRRKDSTSSESFMDTLKRNKFQHNAEGLLDKSRI